MSIVSDITNPQEQLINYAGTLVGFYDVVRETKDGPKELLYIYKKASNDKFTIVKRKCNEAFKIKERDGSIIFRDEKVLYRRAYNRYLEIKKNGGFSDPEKDILKARIAELEAASIRPAKKIEKKEKKSISDLEIEFKKEEIKE